MAGSSKRLLIMDGHLSHCTLRFLLYAERNGIVVVCLPPHTTHRLQPLDVGVFNVLGKAWSSEVKAAGDKGYKITKFNVLSFYSKARNKAFTPANICSSFEKCGIWPFNSSVVTEEELAPADNTTIYAAQPLPATLPSFLEIVKEGAPQSVGNNLRTIPASLLSLGTTASPLLQSLDPNRNTDILIRQRDRPPLPSRYASKKDLLDTITTLNHQLDRAIGQHCADHAQMVLMDKENGDIRNRLYGKTNKGRKVTHVKNGSRILTSAAGIEELARSDHKRVVAAIQKDGNTIFKARLKQLSAREKELAKEEEDDEKRKVKAAGGVMKERKGKMEGMVKRKVRVEEWLKSAEARAAKAKTPATIAKAEKDCERYETELEELGMSMKELEPQLITATEVFTRLSEQRKARLALIEAAEKAYQDAVDQEKRRQEEKDAIDKAEFARKAKLPHRPADPTTLWTTRFQDEEIEDPLTKEDQGDVLNGELGPFFPLGWFMRSVNGADNTSEDTYQAYHGPDDINTKHIDPSLVAQARLARRNLTEAIPSTATPSNPM
jgi:DDE superfamily endonuclease